MKYRDYYEVLGVSKDADANTIKKAYRKLAKEYHPDLHPDDTKAQEKFKEINEAYEVLGDEEKRKTYDQFGSSAAFHGGQNFDPSAYGFGNSYTYTTGGGYSDFFNLIFGSRAQSDFSDLFRQSERTYRNPYGASNSNMGAKGARYKTEMHLSMEDAFRGGEKTLDLQLGTQKHTVTVAYPSGIGQGKSILVRQKKSGLDGDLLVKIHIDVEGTLDGLDWTKSLMVYPWEAYFGATKTVQTLEGSVRVKVPAQAKSGQKLRLPNKGYRDRKGERGDLYLQIQLENPKSLSEEEEKWYRALQQRYVETR